MRDEGTRGLAVPLVARAFPTGGYDLCRYIRALQGLLRVLHDVGSENPAPRGSPSRLQAPTIQEARCNPTPTHLLRLPGLLQVERLLGRLLARRRALHVKLGSEVRHGGVIELGWIVLGYEAGPARPG